MKHYVLGFVVNVDESKILLVEKQKPDWQRFRWNGIGGKIEPKESPFEAMDREGYEETNCRYDFQHVITFVCPGGTVFVYLAKTPSMEIPFEQVEDEKLLVWGINSLPEKIMNNLKYLIPLALSKVKKPVMLQQNTLGVH